MVCGSLFFNIIFRVLVVRHWWAFGACDFLQLYAILELLLMDRTQPHEVRPQKLFVQARRTVTRCGPGNNTGLISYKGNYFFVCV